MYKYLHYLIQPGVVSTGLMGTALQVGIAFANSFNVAGAADMISQYGLNGQLTSGGLIAALTGAYYSITQRKVGHTVAAGAGAVAGGISGTLGTAVTQALGWTAVAEGTTPLLNFTAITTALMSWPSRCGAKPRRVVSTSGSSGIFWRVLNVAPVSSGPAGWKPALQKLWLQLGEFA